MSDGSIQFSDLNLTYLDDSAVRIAEMIRVADAGQQAVDYIDPNMTPPFWWVYLGSMKLVEKSQSTIEQNFDIICRKVIGYTTEGIDGKNQKKMRLGVISVANFLFSHKRLMYTAPGNTIPHMEPPKYLLPSNVSVSSASTFGAYQDGSNHIGIELCVSLVFNINVEQEF